MMFEEHIIGSHGMPYCGSTNVLPLFEGSSTLSRFVSLCPDCDNLNDGTLAMTQFQVLTGTPDGEDYFDADL